MLYIVFPQNYCESNKRKQKENAGKRVQSFFYCCCAMSMKQKKIQNGLNGTITIVCGSEENSQVGIIHDMLSHSTRNR